MASLRADEERELLEIEQCDAWFDYLERTRGQPLCRYLEIEPWAWAELGKRLRHIDARLHKLRREQVVREACGLLADIIDRWARLGRGKLSIKDHKYDAEWALAIVRQKIKDEAFWQRSNWTNLVSEVTQRINQLLRRYGSSYRHFVSVQY